MNKLMEKLMPGLKPELQARSALARIQGLSGLEKKTLVQRALKLSEECGELSEAVLGEADASGMAYKRLKPGGVEEEACDVIQVALSICFMKGMTVNDIVSMLNKKCAKWEEKMGR